MDFKYKVLFLHQEGCHPCQSMKPIWTQVASEIEEEYPFYKVGFGMWDVNVDDWELADEIGIDGTPGFAIFDSENNLLNTNIEGAMPASKLKSWIIGTIE